MGKEKTFGMCYNNAYIINKYVWKQKP